MAFDLSYIAPTPAFPIFNVVDYGAKGDGSDDSAAFQAAINAATGTIGGTVYIPSSRNAYGIATGLTIDGPCKVMGGGGCSNNTILKFTGSGGGAMITITSNGNGTELCNFSVDQGSSGNATDAIQVNGLNCFLHHIFTNATYKFSNSIINTYQASNYVLGTMIEDCIFNIKAHDTSNFTPYGIIIGGGNTQIIRNCHMLGFATAAIFIKPAGGGFGNALGPSVINTYCGAFDGTSVSYPGSTSAIGIYVTGGTGLSVVGCNFQMNGNEGASAAGQRAIKIDSCDTAWIAGCLFDRGGETGSIDVTLTASGTAKHISFFGCNFYDCATAGIENLSASNTYTVHNCELGGPTPLLVTDAFTQPSSTGTWQLANTGTVGWRNNANNGDLGLGVNTSDQLKYNGHFFLDSDGTLLIGANAGTATNVLASFRIDAAADKHIQVRNDNVSGNASFYATTVDNFFMRANGSSAGNNAQIQAGSAFADLSIEGLGASTPVKIRTNGSIGLMVTSKQSVLAGTAGMTTTATDGFLYMPYAPGTPTGTPASQSGFVPFYYDSTNHKIWVYDGAWKGVVVS